MTTPHETPSEYSRHPAVESFVPRQGYSSAPGYRTEVSTLQSPLAQAQHGSTNATTATPTQGGSGSSTQVASGYCQHGSGQAAKVSPARLQLSPINMDLPVEARGAEVLRLAIEAFPQTDNWVIFYREILGVEGVARKLFNTAEELGVWESTPQFEEVHTMLSALRSHDTGKGDTIESQRMITVRLPASLHEVLKCESDEQGLSINKLCITKLLHKLDSRFVPQEPGKRRGRKPGPQGKRAPKSIG